MQQYETSTKAVACMMCDEHSYFTKKDVMELFQVSLPPVDSWMREGVLEKTLIGPKLVRFSKTQIQKLITENGVPHA